VIWSTRSRPCGHFRLSVDSARNRHHIRVDVVPKHCRSGAQSPGTIRPIVVRIVGFGLASVIQALSVILIARTAGAADFGVYAQFIAAGTVAGIILSLGFDTRIMTLGSSDRYGSVAATAMILRLSAVFVISGGVVGFALLATDVSFLVIAASCATLGVELVSPLVQSMLSARNKVGWAVVLVLAQRATILAAVLSMDDIFFAAVIGYGASSIYAVAVAVPMLSRPASLGEASQRMPGYWWSSVAPTLSQLEVVVSGGLGGNALAGLYASGSRLMSPLSTVTNALTAVFLPRLARDARGGTRNADYVTLKRLTWSMAIALTLASPVVAHFGVYLLGESYSSAWPIIVGFCVAAGLSGVSRGMQTMLYANDRPAIGAMAVTTGALLGIAAVAILAPFGPWGIAAAPMITQVTVLVLMGLGVRRTTRGQSD
jgi:O-antigen/teichoic acid export membrane protein